MEERNARLAQGVPPLVTYEALRKKYLAELANETKRSAILYATRWTQPVPQGCPPELLSITHEDVQAMMEVVHGLPAPNLDLILHSPGGAGVAAEALVIYLRSKFSHIRVIVPHAAMSAATMLACAADEVVMGNHSFLGPIDPQFVLATPLGQRSVPADAVREQFDMAVRECQDRTKATAWFPMLAQYGPDVLVQCENALKLSKDLVRTWLKTYMFKGEEKAEEKADEIANWLSDHKKFNTHGRHISRAELEKHGFKTVELEKDQKLQDLVLSVFHTVTQTFDASGAVKMLANNHGKVFAKMVGMAAMVQAPFGPPVGPTPIPVGGPRPQPPQTPTPPP